MHSRTLKERNISVSLANDGGLDAYEHREPAYPDREHYNSGDTNQELNERMQFNGKHYINGAHDNHQFRASRGGISLDTRNEQQWKQTKY